MKKFILLGYLLYCISVFFTYAQAQHAVQNQYKFKYLTIDQGLSHNRIESICQDSKGFIWIGTQNGLNKYIGQSIVSYWSDENDSTSISDNNIGTLFLDSRNKLWIANGDGLDIYNLENDNFTHFKHDDISWLINPVYSITEDNNNKIWFGAYSGLYSFDLNTSELNFYSSKLHEPNGILPAGIVDLLVDNNKLWLSVPGYGLYVFNQEDSTFTTFEHNPDDPTSLSGNRIEKLYKDSEGNIWAGTLNSGLNRFNPENNSFERFIPDPDNSYSTRVRAIFEDFKGNFFVGTRAGLYLFNKANNKFLLYASEDHNFSQLSQNSILCSFIDNTGTLWIGTFSGGVNYTNLHKKEFTHYTASKNNNHFLSGANINTFTEDTKRNIWIGSDNGLNYLDRSTYTFKYFTNDLNDPHSLSYNDVKCLEWDSRGNLWIGTNRGGLNYFNLNTGKFTCYMHDPEDPHSISGNKVYNLLNDKFNNLWVIVSPSGDLRSLRLDMLPNGADKFVHLNQKPYFGFEQSENGDVYIGARHGFWFFTQKDSAFKFISNEEYIGYINSITKDSKNRIWIGSEAGLTRYNPEDRSFILFSKETGYPISEVFGILEDESYNLWISTNNGLVKLLNIVQDTTDIKINVYDHYDGLQSKQFNFNAYYKCRSGEMVFGGTNGFNTFFPDRITDNKLPADVVLIDLRINNISVPIGKKVEGQVILHKSITVTNEIILGPKHKIISLEFASPQNVGPDKYAYRTRLIGLNEDWQYRKAGNNQVTYTNLEPGDYTFKISAANVDGYWNEEAVELKIIVVPPFWKTWWFRIIALITILGLIWGTYYIRLRSIRNQNLVLEKTVRNRTQEVTEKNKLLQEANEHLLEKQEMILVQNEELELHRNNLESLINDRTIELEKALAKAKESDELKSAFLANMSHEIRTPMNAITGFSSLLNEDGLASEERAEFTQIIQSNSKDLLKIIDGILDMSLIESNQLILEKEIFELNVFIDHLFSYYFLNNTNSKIKVQKNNTLENLNLKINTDSVRLKQIIINLMDNASKFTEEGYIELGAYADKENLCIYVKDTGRGIPSKSIDHIFQQFTKLEDDAAGWTQGLGLGLSISQKIADELGAMIIVKSAKGEGSIFTFSIPMKNVVTKNEIIVQELRKPIPNRWRGKTIMIAEDVEANFLYLKNVLKKTQTDIIWAKNGEEALKLAIENPKIDLILMDIKMPVLNGYEVAKKIKEHNPDQIIVAQTAYARPEERVKFQDESFDEYLSKPINPADLLTILEKYI